MKQLEQVDLKDLSNYVATGRSPKYDNEKILGRWQLYPSATVTQLKKKNPNLTIPQLNLIKRTLKEKMSDVIFLALADNQVLIKGSAGNLEQVAVILSGRAQGPAPKAGGQPSGPPGAPAAAPAAGGGGVIVQGIWKKEEGKYAVTFNGNQNEEITILQDNQVLVGLVTTFYGGALVFLKAD